MSRVFLTLALIVVFVPRSVRAQGAIYPRVDYCECSTTMGVAQDLMDKYLGNAANQVRKMNKLLSEIRESRVFEVRIESRYDASLRAKIVWKGSPWERLNNMQSQFGYLEKMAPSAISALTSFGGLRDSLRDLVAEARKLDPKSGESKWMTHTEAVKIIEKLHAETKSMDKAARSLREAMYCGDVLPIELSLIAVLNRGHKQCKRDKENAQAFDKLGAKIRAAGSDPAGVLEIHPTFMGVSDTQVWDEIKKCEKRGYPIKPHPVLAPAKVCGRMHQNAAIPKQDGTYSVPGFPDNVPVVEVNLNDKSCVKDTYMPNDVDPAWYRQDSHANCPKGYITRGKDREKGGRWCAYCGPGFKSKLNRALCCQPEEKTW